MNRWPMVRLGEVCSLNPRRDKTISYETVISFIEMKSLLENGSVFPVEKPAKQYLKGFSSFRNRDVLVAKITPCFQNHKIGLADIGTDFGFGTTEFHVLRAHEKQLLPEYLTLFLRQRCVLIAGEVSMTGSGGQRRVPNSFFENLQIPLPPLEEQKRIAEILGGVAEAIVLVQKQCRRIKQLEHEVFREFKKACETSHVTVKEVCSVYTGATPSRKVKEYYNGVIPWVKTAEVNETVIKDTEERITERAVAETNCRRLPVGTTLVAMYGQGVTRGRSGILGCEAATNQACAAVVPHKSDNQEFVYAVLRNSYSELRNLGRGGTQPNLNLTLVKNFKIPWPDLVERKKFVDQWMLINDIHERFQQKITLLQELQRSLSSRVFAGEL